MHLSAHWVFPFGHRRINAWLATPRRFSQPPTSFIASWHLGIHRTPLVAYLPKSLVLTPTSRRVLSKLETKVQAQGSSPYGPQRLTAFCFTCAPSQCVSPWAAANDLRALEVTLETQGQGLENFCSQQKLNSTLRMHLSKSSCPARRHKARSGAGRVRTDDIQLAKLALSQLSYSPGNLCVVRRNGDWLAACRLARTLRRRKWWA